MPPSIWKLAPLVPAFVDWEEKGGMAGFLEKHGLKTSLMDIDARWEAPFEVAGELVDIITSILEMKAVHDAVQKEHNKAVLSDLDNQRNGLQMMAVAEGWGWDVTKMTMTTPAMITTTTTKKPSG